MAKKQKISLNDSATINNPFGSLDLPFDSEDIQRGEKAQAQNEQVEKSQKIITRIRLEKSGRGGKTVTVLYDWENIKTADLKRTFKQVKKHLATGGSFQEDSLEFQGDQRQKAADFLNTLNIQVKGQLS